MTDPAGRAPLDRQPGVYAVAHVQLAMPPGREESARAFYGEVLGLSELPKPAHLATRGGAWFGRGGAHVHLGVDARFRPARKAHPALLVHDLDALIRRCQQAGYPTATDEPLAGYRRVYVSDPFGNRIELMEPVVDEGDEIDRARALQDSWEANAEAWTDAVRGRRIPSRQAATDAAILRACARLRPGRVLDVGCGEGWLARALAEGGAQVVGIDASAALIERATAAGGGRFELLDYDAIIVDSTRVPGPWDVIVCNFALLGDPLTPLLRALHQRLSSGGRLLIHTVHPWAAVGEAPYRNGWRTEQFTGFGVPFPASMPWYFRTMESWLAEVHGAGFAVVTLGEPVDPETGRPLSLLLECGARNGAA